MSSNYSQENLSRVETFSNPFPRSSFPRALITPGQQKQDSENFRKIITRRSVAVVAVAR